MKKHNGIRFLVVLIFSAGTMIFAQVNLSGTVTDGASPLSGCVVTLADDGNYTTTSETGAFALSDGSSTLRRSGDGGLLSWTSEGSLFFKTDTKLKVSVDILDVTGRQITSVFNSSPDAGIHSVVPWSGAGNNLSFGIYLVRIRAGTHTATHPMLFDGSTGRLPDLKTADNHQVLRKAGATPDTLNILCAGYLPLQVELSSRVGDLGNLTAAKPDWQPPNFLFSIADDWSYGHAGAYGSKMMNTPAFDRVAREGILFHNVWYTAPQCAPSRSTIATSRHLWGNEEAGTHNGWFPENLEDAYADGSSVHAPGQQAPVHLDVFAEFLEDAGYAVGFTRKGINPFVFENDRKTLGTEITHGSDSNDRWTGSIDGTDYADCFNDFLATRDGKQPFFWWFGSKEPHRGYSEHSGVNVGGKNLDDVEIPPYYPDNEEVRHDYLDYALEADWHDYHLAQMIARLEETGELENTIIIATGDNGMPWPRGKASLYDEGTHAPFAVRWGGYIQPGRVNYDMLSFVDLAPTFLELAGLPPGPIMTGKSFAGILMARGSGIIDPSREHVFFGRERHSHARADNMGYPSRGIRTREYLYIRNFKPDRWPMGNPDCSFGDMDGGITTDLMENYFDNGIHPEYTDLSLAKRPGEELYDNVNDPFQMNNLAEDPAYQTVKQELWTRLEAELKSTGDPRILGYGDVWDSYPRMYTNKCDLGWFDRGAYNPDFWDSAVQQAEALGITIKQITE